MYFYFFVWLFFYLYWMPIIFNYWWPTIWNKIKSNLQMRVKSNYLCFFLNKNYYQLLSVFNWQTIPIMRIASIRRTYIANEHSHLLNSISSLKSNGINLRSAPFPPYPQSLSSHICATYRSWIIKYKAQNKYPSWIVPSRAIFNQFHLDRSFAYIVYMCIGRLHIKALFTWKHTLTIFVYIVLCSVAPQALPHIT